MLDDIMRAGAAAMGISMTARQAAQFQQYHDLLARANARMNLTRVPDDLREAADRNYLDCIAPLSSVTNVENRNPSGSFGATSPFRGGYGRDGASPERGGAERSEAEGLFRNSKADGIVPQALCWPEAEKAVDVGSGAGFPGIPLAIMCPDTRFTLLDAQSRRVDFLREVIEALQLNAEAVHARAEDAARNPALREGFDLAVARAVAPMNVLSEYLLPFVRVGGYAMALKGPGLDAELRDAEAGIALLGGRLARVQALTIPGRDWDHRAAWIHKTDPTPDRYPRRAGMPEKRPL